MANEKLVSSIFFRGTKVGSNEINIIDTSLPAIYNVSINDSAGQPIPDAMNIQVGLNTTILVQQNPKRADVPKFWYGLTGTSASKFDINIAGGPNQPLLGEVTIPVSGVSILNLQVNFYPSLVNLDATLTLYHDQARTFKFATIPLRSKAVAGAKLRLTSVRNINNQPEVEPFGIYNNDVLTVQYTDPNINQSNMVTLPFKTKINGLVIPSGNYPADGSSWILGPWENAVNGYGTSGLFVCSAQRQKNPTVIGNVPIEITMGDLVVTNTLMDEDVSYLRGYQKLSRGIATPYLSIVAPLPAGVTDIYTPYLSFGYSFVQSAPVPAANFAPGNPYSSVPSPPAANYLTNVVTKRTSSNTMEIQPNGIEVRSLTLDTIPMTDYSKGEIGYLAWDRDKLDTVKKRKQFGKFQKSLSLLFKFKQEGAGVSYTSIGGDNLTINETSFYSRNLTLAVVQDPIATSLYGALTSLNSTTLATFTFVTRDQSVADPKYAIEASIRFLGNGGVLSTFFYDYRTQTQVKLPAPNPANPTDLQFRVDMLFLRNNGKDEKNTFDIDTPYPRIINVQTNRGYEAYKFTNSYGTFWDFEVNPSLGIDLTDGRYSFMTTVQNDSDWDLDLTKMQSVTLVARSPNKLTFRFGSQTTQPNMSLAIVENGPTPIPAAGNYIFKPVNIPNGSYVVYTGAGTPVTGLSYGAGTVIKGTSKVSNYGIRINAVLANHTANRGSYAYGIHTEFYNFQVGETSSDVISFKPDTLYVRINNGVKHKLTRYTVNGTGATYPIHQYVIQGLDATPANLDAWLNDLTANIGKETNFTVSLF